MPLVPHVAAGQIVASTWGNLVADHTVMRFTTDAQRTSQLPTPILNQLTSVDARPGLVEYWTGTAWAPLGTIRDLAYAQFTASVTVPSGIGAAVVVVSSPAVTFDGGPVWLEFFAVAVSPPVATSGQIMFNLWDGTTDLGYWGTAVTASGSLAIPVLLRRRLTPTAGSHTFSVKAWCPTGASGSVAAGAGGAASTYQPGYLSITRAA